LYNRNKVRSYETDYDLFGQRRSVYYVCVRGENDFVAYATAS